MIGDEIILNVPNGIGDIFWIYQKFAPYFRKIYFNVLVIGHDAVQTRAVKFLSLLPKFVGFSCRVITPDEYTTKISKFYKMSEIFDCCHSGAQEFDYSCNFWLENGHRIDAIDEEYPLEWSVDIKTDYCPVPYEKYITLYVSGSTKEKGVWPSTYWVDLVKRIHDKLNLPVIVIGADYDKSVILPIGKMLTKIDITNTVFIDSYISNVCYIIRNSTVFIGFQSGLNVIADNFNVKQLMIYFPRLVDMYDKWPKRCNIDNKIFNADFFTSTPEHVVNKFSENL